MQLISNPLVDIAEPVDRLAIGFLTIGGLGLDVELNKDGSGTPVEAWFQSDGVTVVHAITFVLLQAGLKHDGFGKDQKGLDNGLLLTVQQPTQVETVPIGLLVTRHAHLATLSGTAFANNDMFTSAWYPGMSAGRPLKLHNGDQIHALIQDDLTEITSLRILVHGVMPR